MVKEEFKDIDFHHGGHLNLMVIRDTQSSRKVDIYGYRGIFFLTFGFKDVMCDSQKKRLDIPIPGTSSPFSAGKFGVGLALADSEHFGAA